VLWVCLRLYEHLCSAGVFKGGSIVFVYVLVCCWKTLAALCLFGTAPAAIWLACLSER